MRHEQHGALELRRAATAVQVLEAPLHLAMARRWCPCRRRAASSSCSTISRTTRAERSGIRRPASHSCTASGEKPKLPANSTWRAQAACGWRARSPRRAHARRSLRPSRRARMSAPFRSLDWIRLPASAEAAPSVGTGLLEEVSEQLDKGCHQRLPRTALRQFVTLETLPIRPYYRGRIRNFHD